MLLTSFGTGNPFEQPALEHTGYQRARLLVPARLSRRSILAKVQVKGWRWRPSPEEIARSVEKG